MTLIAVISTENAILCGSIMPIIAPIRFYKLLIYMDFIHPANDTFVARRHQVRSTKKPLQLFKLQGLFCSTWNIWCCLFGCMRHKKAGL